MTIKPANIRYLFVNVAPPTFEGQFTAIKSAVSSLCNLSAHEVGFWRFPAQIPQAGRLKKGDLYRREMRQITRPMMCISSTVSVTVE